VRAVLQAQPKRGGVNFAPSLLALAMSHYPGASRLHQERGFRSRWGGSGRLFWPNAEPIVRHLFVILGILEQTMRLAIFAAAATLAFAVYLAPVAQAASLQPHSKIESAVVHAKACVGTRGGKYKDFNDCMRVRRSASYCSKICK
jgi:hypothetical protein